MAFLVNVFFMNDLFLKIVHKRVIRPFVSLFNLKVWYLKVGESILIYTYFVEKNETIFFKVIRGYESLLRIDSVCKSKICGLGHFQVTSYQSRK